MICVDCFHIFQPNYIFMIDEVFIHPPDAELLHVGNIHALISHNYVHTVLANAAPTCRRICNAITCRQSFWMMGDVYLLFLPIQAITSGQSNARRCKCMKLLSSPLKWPLRARPWRARKRRLCKILRSKALFTAFYCSWWVLIISPMYLNSSLTCSNATASQWQLLAKCTGGIFPVCETFANESRISLYAGQ